MKTFKIFLAVCISAFICSCTNNTSTYKSSAKLYKNVDYKSFVGVAGIDPAKAKHVKKLLDSNEIPNVIEGSVLYGVSVPPDKKEKAIGLLKSDSEKNKYYIKF